jgi:hypothetical protein
MKQTFETIFTKAKLPTEFKLEKGTYYLITHNNTHYLEVNSVKQLKLAIKEIKQHYEN